MQNKPKRVTLRHIIIKLLKAAQEQLYVNELDKLDEIDKFLEKYKLKAADKLKRSKLKKKKGLGSEALILLYSSKHLMEN